MANPISFPMFKSHESQTSSNLIERNNSNDVVDAIVEKYSPEATFSDDKGPSKIKVGDFYANFNHKKREIAHNSRPFFKTSFFFKLTENQIESLISATKDPKYTSNGFTQWELIANRILNITGPSAAFIAEAHYNALVNPIKKQQTKTGPRELRQYFSTKIMSNSLSEQFHKQVLNQFMLDQMNGPFSPIQKQSGKRSSSDLTNSNTEDTFNSPNTTNNNSVEEGEEQSKKLKT